MPPCARRVEIDMQLDGLPEKVHRRFGRQQRCDREVAVDMLPWCRRSAGAAGAARRDHDGYSDTPGLPVLPDGGTLRLAHHAEKNSETRGKKSRRSRSSGPLGALLSSPALDVRLMTALQVLQVADDLVRVTPRVSRIVLAHP